jgi:hypothetical protein
MDESNRVLTLQMSGAPPGAFPLDARCSPGYCRGYFHWRIPDEVEQREYFVTFTASDGLLSSSARVRIMVVDPFEPSLVLQSSA